MRTTPLRSLRLLLCLGQLAGLSLPVAPGFAQDDESGVLTAVFAKTDKGYKRQNGHRQNLLRVRIEKIKA